MYSSLLAMTSIDAYGRSVANVFDSSWSDCCSPPITSAIVITLRAEHASPITAAACALVPALDTITTRSAPDTSSISSLLRPARSLTQADQLSPVRGAPSNLFDAKNVVRSHVRLALQ